MSESKIRLSLFLGALALVLAGSLVAIQSSTSPMNDERESDRAVDRISPGPPPGRQQAILAGGCFWSMEAIFKRLKGVEKAEPGYSGGKIANPTYERVETGDTGYAESLNVIFDPRVISYRDLLRVFFTLRDPTTLDRQGNDVGPQYRSIIFYQNPEQKRVARQAMEEIAKERIWKRPLVTELIPFVRFYRAEDYHIDYYRRHPYEPYCQEVIAPEIAEFQSKFKSMLKR